MTTVHGRKLHAIKDEEVDQEKVCRSGKKVDPKKQKGSKKKLLKKAKTGVRDVLKGAAKGAVKGAAEAAAKVADNSSSSKGKADSRK